MKKILIIDSDENTTFALKKMLESETFNVFCCNAVSDAFSILQSEVFDLVITDPQMTGTEDFDVAGWLFNHSYTTKVIFLANNSIETPVRAGNVIESFPRPVDYLRVVMTIKENLGERGGSSPKDVNFQNFIRLVCMRGATRAILVRRQEKKGIILISDGKIIYAEQGSLKGEAALFKIMSWKNGDLKEIKVKKFPPANIKRTPLSLFSGVNPDGDKVVGSVEPPKAGGEHQHAVALEYYEETETFSETFTELTPVTVETSVKMGGERPAPKRRMLKALTAIVAIIVLLLLTRGYVFNGGTIEKAIAEIIVQSAPAEQENIKSAQNNDEKQAVKQSIVIGSLIEKNVIEQKMEERIILRLHGSNTIGADLAPSLIKQYLKNELGAEKVEVVAGEKSNEVYLKALFSDHVKVVEIQAHGSSTGLKDMAAGLCDVAMASRKVKPKEVTALAPFGDMTSNASEHVIALDGIAVIINKTNPVDSLDTGKIAELFSGKISDWSDFGETEGEINVYARDNRSGTYDTFKSIILGKNNPLKANAKRFESNLKLSDSVAKDRLAIGFTSLPNIHDSKGIAVSDGGAKAAYPNFFTVATEDYPISRRLYLYTASNPANKYVRDFVRFTLSYAGQKVVESAGFVDMNIRSFQVAAVDMDKVIDRSVVKEYIELSTDGRRLSLNFRFKSGMATLDNRGIRDLQRLVEYLKDKLEKKVVLAGFADSGGDYEVNMKLARIRAQTVAAQLRARGIVIDRIISCGEELPVAANSSLVGREKNRRVEVWLI